MSKTTEAKTIKSEPTETERTESSKFGEYGNFVGLTTEDLREKLGDDRITEEKADE
jgi:hypothetical protein